MPPSPQAKRWCFTWNVDLTVFDVAAAQALLENIYWGECGVAQLEVAPSTGQVHIQGCVMFKTNQRLPALKKVCSAAHWEIMKGSWDQAAEYCRKEESRMPGSHPWSWGEQPVAEQGKRNDLKACAETMKSLIAEGLDRDSILRRLAEEHTSVMINAVNGIERTLARLAPVVRRPPPVWYPWQKALHEYLMGPAHPRWILWIHEARGNVGKSKFIDALMDDPANRAQALSGRIADMCHALAAPRIVFFDIARTAADNTDHLYNFAEQVKNGSVFSSKYDSQGKRFAIPHVVFFSNVAPNMEKWSRDRYKVFELADGKKSIIPTAWFTQPTDDDDPVMLFDLNAPLDLDAFYPGGAGAAMPDVDDDVVEIVPMGGGGGGAAPPIALMGSMGAALEPFSGIEIPSQVYLL